MRCVAWGTPPAVRFGSANSPWATPILSSTHSIASTPPVSIAKRGILPCALVLGSVRWEPFAPLLTVFAVHEAMDWVKARCHLPSCTTIGTAAPFGTPVSVKEPSMAVNADAYAGGAVQPQVD